MSQAIKVARRFVASYFKLNDVILWGKWKNHRGKITAFGADHWGNPTITVEPIPLGRKQPKTMNLFHVWRADVKENAMKKLLEQQKTAVIRINPNSNLQTVRNVKQQLFESLSPTEIEVLKIVAGPTTVYGRLGTETVVFGPSKKQELAQWGKDATRLVRAGWLRFFEGPTRDGHGMFHLTTGAENALRAFSEGTPLMKTAAEDVDKHFLEVWAKSLNRQAEGLNLKDSEDRVTFRLNVVEITKNLRVSGLQTIAANLGADKSSSRDSLTKAIANAYIAGKQIKLKEANTMDITKRVVARYAKVAGIDMGRTYVSAEDMVRVQRYRDHFRVWDLTNAGKKGKKVDGMTFQPSHSYEGNADEWMNNLGKDLPHAGSFKDIKSLIKELQEKFPHSIELNEFTERGIDVLPASSSPVQLETETGIKIKADPLDFSVVNSVTHTGPKGNSFKQDTLFSPRKKQDALLFYTWLKSNLSKVNKMDMNTLRDTWKSEGIQYDYH